MLESRVVPHAAKKRTTIGIKKATKAKLDADRAPGQCYDGFLCQLIEFWEMGHSRHIERGPAGGNQGA
jgi:hypothetical protein